MQVSREPEWRWEPRCVGWLQEPPLPNTKGVHCQDESPYSRMGDIALNRDLTLNSLHFTARTRIFVWFSMQICAHIVAEGLVQGVGFRYYVHRHATSLGLSGIAANLMNGSVEIEVEGDRSVIEEFIKLVKVGPRSAQVTNLVIEWKTYQHRYSRFEIR